MKIAVTSAVFAAALRRGELTHLEWLEACASRLELDGVVLARDDVPRTDREYAAQVKKVATDLGLVPVALDVPGLLDPDRRPDERTAALELAAALGAGLIRVSAGPPGDLPPETFARTVAAAKGFAALAKAANLTLTVAPGAGSLLATVADVQKLAKFVDSAWLRYDLPAGDPDRGLLGGRDRVLVERVGLEEDVSGIAPLRRGWFVLEGDGGADPFAAVAAAVGRLRATRVAGAAV
jgi:sugar phosphate isomerase/epimerase